MKDHFDVNTLQRRTTRDRVRVEKDTQAGLDQDGRARLRSDKVKALLYRCTQERRDQLTRLAEILTERHKLSRKVSFTETVDAALDALERELKAGD
jgi:hypothetical protein